MAIDYNDNTDLFTLEVSIIYNYTKKKKYITIEINKCIKTVFIKSFNSDQWTVTMTKT